LAVGRVQRSEERNVLRTGAFAGLAALGPKAEPEFRDFLDSLIAAGKWPEIYALKPALLPTLFALAADPSAPARESAMEGLVFPFHHPNQATSALASRIIAALVTALDDPDPEIRHAAARNLRVSNLPRVIEKQSGRGNVPRWAIPVAKDWAQVDAPLRTRMVERLILALDDSVPQVQSFAMGALGSCGAEAAAAVPRLVAFRGDPTPNSRERDKSVARALANIGCSPELVVPPLRKLPPAQDAQVRFAAANALVQFGVRDPSVKDVFLAVVSAIARWVDGLLRSGPPA